MNTHKLPICELRGVHVRFPGPKGKPLRVLEDIHLEVRHDEILAVLGPNGSGKSTLLRLIAGLVQPTGGEVRFESEPLEGVNPATAMVFQSFALYPWMTVEENVRVVLRAQELPEPEVQARAHEAIRKVGLEGFEEAYPRELSRGTKQRVGVARALATDPAILLMDEPFSQVDALTAEALRAEILDIWDDTEKNPSAVVMVSNSVTEALLMADRIAVLSGVPGTIRAVVDVPLPRPRAPKTLEFLALLDHVHDIITSAELPDVQVTPALATISVDLVEPLPATQSADVLGLLEFLDTQGGNSDLFIVASHLHIPFERLLPIVKAAEMLDLVDTPRRGIVLTPLGQRFVQAGMDERKDLWREQLLTLRLFKAVYDQLGHFDGELPREEVIQEIATRLPMEDPHRTFETLVAWGRFGELFAYREEKGVLTFE